MREQIEARLAELKAQREQLIANLNVYNGAIMENERWLGKLDQPEPGVTPDAIDVEAATEPEEIDP